MSVSIQTSQNVLLEYEPASLGERILALLIDYVIILAWVILTVLLLRYLSGGASNVEAFAWITFVALPIMFYDLLCEIFLNGQSLGKRAMNIRVVMLDGSQPGLGAYLLRWLLRLIESPGFLGGLIPILTIAINGKGQRVGDIAAGTTVVKLKSAVTLDEVTYPDLPANYQVTFPEVIRLTDRDINTIREVMQRGGEEVVSRTAEKVRSVLDVNHTASDYTFLLTVLNDYQYLVSK